MCKDWCFEVRHQNLISTNELIWVSFQVFLKKFLKWSWRCFRKVSGNFQEYCTIFLKSLQENPEDPSGLFSIISECFRMLQEEQILQDPSAFITETIQDNFSSHALKLTDKCFSVNAWQIQTSQAEFRIQTEYVNWSCLMKSWNLHKMFKFSVFALKSHSLRLLNQIQMNEQITLSDPESHSFLQCWYC